MPKIVLRNSAFIGMIVNCVEVYKKEAWGLLLGARQGKNFVVKYALGFQSAQRDYEFVSVDKARENRINELLKYVSNQKLVGDFHSHSDFPDKLSKHDLKELREVGSGFASVLLVVGKSKGVKFWKYNARDKSISGSVGRKLVVKIKCFEWDERKQKAVALRVECSYLRMVNKALRFFEKVRKKLGEVKRESEKQSKVFKKLKKLLS